MCILCKSTSVPNDKIKPRRKNVLKNEEKWTLKPSQIRNFLQSIDAKHQHTRVPFLMLGLSKQPSQQSIQALARASILLLCVSNIIIAYHDNAPRQTCYLWIHSVWQNTTKLLAIHEKISHFRIHSAIFIPQQFYGLCFFLFIFVTVSSLWQCLI